MMIKIDTFTLSGYIRALSCIMEEIALAKFYSIEKGIVVGEIRSGAISNKAVKNYLKTILETILDADEPFVLINDVTASNQLSAEQRLMVGSFIKQHKLLLKEKLMALVYVVPNPILQFILNGIFLVNKPPIKYKVFNRLAGAIVWSKELNEKELL